MSEAASPAASGGIDCVNEFEPTPVNVLTELPGGFNDSRVTLNIWSEYHDLAHWLLPLRHRQHDPIELGVKISDKIESFRRTDATFTRNDLDLSRDDTDVTRILLRRHGAIVRRKASSRLRYWNPEYMHYDECVDILTDPEEQVKFFDRFAAVGKSLEWMAEHMAHPDAGRSADGSAGQFNRDSLIRVVQQSSDHSDPQGYLTEVQGQIARSAYTALVWTERDVSTLAQAISVSPTTLRLWLERHAIDPDWNPPERPVTKDWFAYSADATDSDTTDQ